MKTKKKFTIFQMFFNKDERLNNIILKSCYCNDTMFNVIIKLDYLFTILYLYYENSARKIKTIDDIQYILDNLHKVIDLVNNNDIITKVGNETFININKIDEKEDIAFLIKALNKMQCKK